MTSRQFAYLSNYAIYSAMFVYTIAFFSHAVEVAFSVRNSGNSTKFDFAKTDKAGRIGTAGSLHIARLGEICMNSL
jgi:hypothetical protein